VKWAPFESGHDTDDAVAVVAAALPALIGFVAKPSLEDDFVFVSLVLIGLVAKDSVTVDFVFILVLLLVDVDDDEVVLLEVVFEDLEAAAKICIPTVPLLDVEAFRAAWACQL
jgi:hypothetical protein